MTDLITVEQARAVLGRSEPMEEVWFIVGDQVRFDVSQGWEFGFKAKDDGDTLDVYVTVGGGRHKRQLQATKECLLQMCGLVGMTANFVRRLPAPLLTSTLNFFFRQSLAEYTGKNGPGRGAAQLKLQCLGDIATGITQQRTKVLSNLQLLASAEAAARKLYGEDVTLGCDIVHSVKQTWIRVAATSEIDMVDGSAWSPGVQIYNSLIGRYPAAIHGYLYRHDTGTALADGNLPSTGTLARNNATVDEVTAAAAAIITNVLTEIPASFNALEQAADAVIQGAASTVLRDVFAQYRIRSAERTKIISRLAESEEKLTVYSLMQACADTAQGNDPATADALMKLAADLTRTADSQCETCRRLNHIH